MAARKKKTSITTKAKIVYIGRPIEEQPVVYANNIEVIISPFDVQVRLNCIIRTKPGEMEVANQATLALSPQHAEAFHAVLGRAIDALREAPKPTQYETEES